MDAGFRERVRSRQPLVGTFIKSGAHEIAEVLGGTGIDFAVIDAEHAPLGLDRIDRLVLGAHSAELPCLVRLPALAPALAGQMLDLGATGIVVPHVADAEAARAALAESRYRGGRRGYSPSTRAARYGADGPGYAQRADAATLVWCQIEDPEALDHLDAIAAVDEVDCLFIGRADLAMALGVTASDPVVIEAVRAIAAAGQRHGRTIGIFVASMEEVPDLLALGITVFACGSDQSHLAAAGRAMARSLEVAIRSANTR
jgi:2-keto-3-deoxy-L-rhamnonate aldolase RhmA